LTYIESLFYQKLDFQNLIRTYINNHSQQSVTYLDFKSSLESWVLENYKVDNVSSHINWTTWVTVPGANPPEANAVLNFTTDNGTLFEGLAD
jgi:hypothetical protein